MYIKHPPTFGIQIEGLVQERRNSSALAMKLHFSRTNPLKYGNKYDYGKLSNISLLWIYIYIYIPWHIIRRDNLQKLNFIMKKI